MYGGTGSGWGVGTYRQNGFDYSLTVGPPEKWVSDNAHQVLAMSANFTTMMASSGTVCTGYPRYLPWDPRNWYEYAGSLTWLQKPYSKGITPRYLQRGVFKEWGENETQDCDMWEAQLTDRASTVWACIGDDGLPRASGYLPGPVVGASNVFFWTRFLFFDNVVKGSTTVKQIECPARSVCPSSEVKTLDVWFQTNYAPSNLTNKNGADLAGSLVFSTPKSLRNYVQRYTVEVSTEWGPWGNCNYVNGQNKCELDMPPYVGRAGSNQLGGTQCGPTTDVGVWYSFPSVGRCGDGEAVGTRGCTWRAKLERMVTADCIKEHDDGAFMKAWDEDHGKAPFPKVQAAVLAAIEACPNVTVGAD